MVMGDDELESILDENQSDNSQKPSADTNDELESILRQGQNLSSTGSERGAKGIAGAIKGGGNKKWLVAVISVLAVVLLAATIYFLVWGVQLNKARVAFFVNEDAVSLFVDGQSRGAIDSGHELTLSAGDHDLILQKEGFLELKESFSVERGEEVELVYELLPIPFIEPLLKEDGLAYARLNLDGEEVSFWDSKENKFKSVDTDNNRVAELFDDRVFLQGIEDVIWAKTGQMAIVKLKGTRQLTNMIDNRSLRGAYIPLGERPVQGTTNYNGVTTWLFDDAQNDASGWEPVLLNESIREVAFAADGGSILYIYGPQGEEYSLVRSDPDGDEWRRVVIELGSLNDPELFWSVDDRFLVISDTLETYLVDVIAGTFDLFLSDRVNNTELSFSSDGDKLAYISEDENGNERISVYDLVEQEKIDWEFGREVDELQGIHFVWTSNDTLLLALPGQTFREFDVMTGAEKTIPFVGQDINFEILEMEYSRLGKMLLLETSTGLYKMRL